MTVDLRGTHGGLRAGYQDAALFTGWTLTGSSDSNYTLTATVMRRVDAWMALPLTLWLEMEHSEWNWTDAFVTESSGATLTVITRGMPTIVRRN